MTSCSLVNPRRSLAWFSGWLSKLIRSDAAFNGCKLCPHCKQALYLVTGCSACTVCQTILRFSNNIFSKAIQGAGMLEGLFQPMHLLVIFGIALLVFGPKKLPELGKGIGEGIRGFKSAMKADEDKPLATATPVANDQSLTKEKIVGFVTEILFVLVLGLLVLGPKRLHATLAHLARAKAQFEEASR